MAETHRSATVSFSARIFLLALISFVHSVKAQNRDTVLLPVRNLRIAIHVFQDDAGNGNFNSKIPDDVNYLNRLVEWANNRLANLDTLRPAVPSPFIADSRVRIRIDTVYYHRDSKAWDCSVEIDAPYMRDQYVDGDTLLDYQEKYQTLPVFIGANNLVIGGHSRNIGDRGYIAVRGYYENYLRQPSPVALDESGRNLIHELCHCLGLSHNFTGGNGGDQCDGCEDNGCPVEGTSNNIMDYWPSYGYALSECQFKQVHFYLNGGMGNISEVVINDSCYRMPGFAWQVEGGDTLVIADTVYAHQDIVIRGGGVLKVTGYLSMPGDSGITVEPGASLEIDGGGIGNLCGDLWLGIRVEESTGPPARIAVYHNGMVENARTGVLAAGLITTVFENSVFRNCEESLVFLPGSADSILIKNSFFRITSKLNHYEEGITPAFFIRSAGIPVLKVSGVGFINEPGTYVFDADWMGTGIYTDGASVVVTQSEFLNLTTGIDLYSSVVDAKIDITDNLFTHNRFGIKTQFAGVQWIENNRFVLQRFNSGCSIGVFLGSPNRFALSRNRFESVYGGGKMAGIALSHPSLENAPVFNNHFSNLPAAIFMDGMPDIDSVLFQWAGSQQTEESLRLGPQFRFNRFDTVDLQLAIVTDSIFGSAYGKPADIRPESFISVAKWNPGGFAWYNRQLPMSAFHGWNPEPSGNRDHGLYWFMNYPGIEDPGFILSGNQGFDVLKEYLREIKDMEEAGDWMQNSDVYQSLSRVSGVPAALRSAKLVSFWEKFDAENQTWLREALGSISGRFVKADSLLIGLGTLLARENLNKWMRFQPISGIEYIPTEHPASAAFDLPDLSAFLFVKLPQESSGPPAFQVYPNPAFDHLIIQPMPGYSFDPPWEGTVTSADGRLSKRIRIESWENQRLTVSSLPAGVFIIELFSGNQYLGTAKFIKTTHR